MNLQARLAGVNFDGPSGTDHREVVQADGPGNSAWQQTIMANARLNAQQRRN